MWKNGESGRLEKGKHKESIPGGQTDRNVKALSNFQIRKQSFIASLKIYDIDSQETNLGGLSGVSLVRGSHVT